MNRTTTVRSINISRIKIAGKWYKDIIGLEVCPLLVLRTDEEDAHIISNGYDNFLNGPWIVFRMNGSDYSFLIAQVEAFQV